MLLAAAAVVVVLVVFSYLIGLIFEGRTARTELGDDQPCVDRSSWGGGSGRFFRFESAVGKQFGLGRLAPGICS